MESHYCRSSTTKLYLEPMFDSFNTLYREYRTSCGGTSGTSKLASKGLFKRIFSEMNIGLFSPKKDLCDVCCRYESGNLSEEIYNLHQNRKIDAREEKERDKENSKCDASLRVVTMDLQAVLLSPKLNASALYYKTKLACHHFTVFDLSSKDVSCYFWHEGQGDLSANSFSSCIAHYIESVVADDSNIKHIIVYSDGCTYQNRNVTLANTLYHISTKFGIEITQKFLEKGHTQMEVDAVHSVIERKVKGRNIHIPQNYVECISDARPSQPYKVNYVDHSFFKDYSALNYYKSVRPGTKVGDSVVTDIRVIHYSPHTDVKYKLSYHDELCDLPRKARTGTVSCGEPVQLHGADLSIKKSKFDHLQALKSVLPRDYHAFYDSLRHFDM